MRRLSLDGVFGSMVIEAMDVPMAAALANGVNDVAGFCRAQGIWRQTFYKWKRRFALEHIARIRAD